MVLFNPNFVFPLARGFTVIIIGSSICQRWRYFLNLNDTKQQSVQNSVFSMQLTINLCSLRELLEYLFVSHKKHIDEYFMMYYLFSIWLACMWVIFIEIWQNFSTHTILHYNLQWKKWWYCARINQQKKECQKKVKQLESGKKPVFSSV